MLKNVNRQQTQKVLENRDQHIKEWFQFSQHALQWLYH